MSALQIDLSKPSGEASPGPLTFAPVSREQIARRAYEISLSPWGRSCEENWAQAEAELHAQRSAWPESR